MIDQLWLTLTVWLVAALAAGMLDVRARRAVRGVTSSEFP